MATVIAAVVAFIATYGWVIKAAIAVYSVYSTFAAYSAAKRAEKAAKRAALAAQNRAAYRNFLNPLCPRRIVYGKARVAGPFLFLHNPDKKKIAWMIVGIASHEIESFEAFWLLKDRIDVVQEHGDWGNLVQINLSGSLWPPIEEAELWSSQDTFGRVTGKFAQAVLLWPFKGEPGQNIGKFCREVYDPRNNKSTYGDSELGITVSGYAKTPIGITALTEDDRFEGIAALVIRTEKFSERFAQQSPDFAATVKGKRVFDPRTGTTRYTANAALCIADYMTNYMSFAWDTLDEEALILAASICDEPVPVKGGGFQPRYEINGVVSADQAHSEVLDMMADAMAGKILYASGRWKIIAGAPVESSHVVDESMVLDEYEVAIEKPTRSLPNAVRGTFFDEGSWQPASFPSYEDAEAIEADGGVVSWLDIELPLTTSHQAAQRIARIMLRRARSRLSLSISMDLRGMLIQAGDVVRYSAPEIGVVDQLMEVQGWQLGLAPNRRAMTTKLDLADYDPSSFAWNEDADTQAMVRGEAQVGSNVSMFLDNVRYTENVTDTEGHFTADFVMTWTNPELSGLELSSVYVEVEVFVVFEDGQTLTIKDTATITGTGATASLHVSADLLGRVYQSHDVIAFARAKLSDGQTGPDQEAEAMA